MKNKKRKTKKKSKYLFSITQDSLGYSETESNRPITFAEQKTYNIRESKNKFSIFEINRKQKPKLVKTYKKRKNLKTKQHVEERVRNKKIRINTIHESKTTYKEKSLIVRQSRKKPTGKQKFQVVALVDVYDPKREISNFYTCWSRKLHYWEMDMADNDLKNMAIAKFRNDYGGSKNSKDHFETKIRQETKRYQTYRKEKV